MPDKRSCEVAIKSWAVTVASNFCQQGRLAPEECSRRVIVFAGTSCCSLTYYSRRLHLHMWAHIDEPVGENSPQDADIEIVKFEGFAHDAIFESGIYGKRGEFCCRL